MSWDADRAQYIVDGEPLDHNDAIALLDEAIASSIVLFRNKMDVSDEDNLDRDAWYDWMSSALFALFIHLYLFGRGGKEQMADSDYLIIAELIDFQTGYLDNFYNEFYELSAAAVLSRSELYLGAARIAFFSGLGAAVLASGQYLEERWMLDPLAEHCPDCVAFASEDWQPIGRWTGTGTYPGSGDTECLGGCRCRLEYR